MRSSTSIARTLLLNAALALTTLTGTSTAAVPASRPATQPKLDLAGALARLADPDITVRDAAQRDLLDAANAVDSMMNQLRAARQNVPASDLDLKLRLDTLLVQVQERIDVGPSRITLHFHEAPLMEVLAELGRQTRATFNDPTAEFGGAAQLPRVSIDVDQVSFWQAIRTLQDQARVSFYPQGELWRVTRGGVAVGAMRGEEAGAFLVQPLSASYSRSVSYQANLARGDAFYLQFQLLTEPKIRLDTTQGMLTIDRAVDSNGNDMIAAQRQMNVPINGGQNLINCNVPLRFPKANSGDRIAEVSGTMKVFMARRLQSLSSDDVAAQTSPLRMQVDGTSISLEIDHGGNNAANGGNNAPRNGTVSMIARVQVADSLSLQRLQQSLQQIRITDAGERLYGLSEFNVQQNDGTRLEIRISFSPPDPQNLRPPVKLRVDVPMSFREIEVPFTLRDLKMP